MVKSEMKLTDRREPGMLPDPAQRDFFSEQTGVASPYSEPGARQEFREECDLNFLLRKFGALPERAVQYGWNDFDLDLQGHLKFVDAAREAYAALPEFIRERYPTIQALLDADALGKLDFSPPAEPVPQSGAGSDGGSQA